MSIFETKTFSIPELKGISAKTIEEHVKLYQGYVKHANLIMEHSTEFANDAEKYAYELGELQRRFAFEWGGIRNHEVYFSLLESGPTPLTVGSALQEKIIEQWASVDAWLERFKSTALIRGIGWAMLYYDKKTDRLMTQWVDEQHLGQLADCQIILALDMWEHSYVADYQPSGKKQYVDDFFENLNWSVAEKLFLEAKSNHFKKAP